MTDMPQMTHELVNDVPVLMHFLRDVLALDRSLDAVWPRHGNWQGLSPGQGLVTWLAHVLSAGDHRMSQAQDWANTLPHTLATLLGQPVRATDLTDDRLAEVATPARGRGQKQFTEDAPRRAAAEAIVRQRDVAGLLRITLKPEVERKAVRAYADRPARTEERRRYVLTVGDHPARIAAEEQRWGWRAYATNAPRTALPLSQAVPAYRDEWLIERDWARLKGRPLSLRPLWVHRDDHAVGLTHLLTRGARVLAVVEYHAREKLQQAGRPLSGLYAGQPTRATDQPTTERLLKAFDRMILTTIQTGQPVQRFLSPLSELQQTILRHLDCPRNLYSQLVSNSPKPLRI